MELTFLSGPVALTKAITYNDLEDSYIVTPYPLVQRVTSHTEHVFSLDEFTDQVEAHGALGHVLLKGGLKRALKNESRAGSWLDDPHQWIVFDFDKVDCEPNAAGAEQAIAKYLPPCCQDVDALIQLSASCHRPDATHLSCHVFMMLDTPATSRELTDWITWINFNSVLADEMCLTDSGMALHFPLDRTVTVPSKLIYIAPPRIKNFESPLDDPLVLIEGRQKTLTIPKFHAVDSTAVSAKINQLRVAANMPEREYRTKKVKDIDVMIDAEACVVHDIKTSGEGYIRFNLNGGDSYAYYINLREPQLIGNHKGEPFLQTQQVAPDLYKALTKGSKSLPAKAMGAANIEPFAFYATNEGSAVYIGFYNRDTDDLRVEVSNAAAAYSWLSAYGVPLKPSLPHYDLVHDVQSDIRFEEGYPIINKFKMPQYMTMYGNIIRMRTAPMTMELVQSLCPITYRVLVSALGNELPAVEYFLNWTAAIFQRRTRTDSGWILHGHEGTGKGIINNMIMPFLLGPEQVTQQLLESVGDNFNEFLEGKLLISINEASMDGGKVDREKIMGKLRDWITEPKISVNGKHVRRRDMRNHSNFIVSANSRKPMVIEAHDRRWNVGEYQTVRLVLSPSELVAMQTGQEMDSFARLMGEITVNDMWLTHPYASAAKARIVEGTHSLLDRVARAVHTGEVEYFLEVRPSTVQLQTDHSGKLLPTAEYDALLRAMKNNTLTTLRSEDLFVLFRMVTMNDRTFPETKAAQRAIFQRFGFDTSQAGYDKRTMKTTRGHKMTVEWTMSEAAEEIFAEIFGEEKAENVSSIKRKKA